MPLHTPVLELSDQERETLQQMTVSEAVSPTGSFRARLVLMLSEGRSYSDIQRTLRTTAPTISRWRKRFLQGGTPALLAERRPGRKPTVITPRLQARARAAMSGEILEGISRCL